MDANITPRDGGVPADLGRPELPGSKSHTQRALVLAALRPGEVTLERPLDSVDTRTLAAALEQLGARCAWGSGELVVRGVEPRPGDDALHLRENGTALRVLSLTLPLLGLEIVLDGDDGLRRRPLAPVLDALDRAGIPRTGAALPLRIDGRGVELGELRVDGRVTTQVGSGAVLGAALRAARGDPGPRTIEVEAPAALDYLTVTASVCRAFGIAVAGREIDGAMRYELGAVTEPPARYAVPPDASAVAFPAVLAAMHGIDWPAPPRGDDPHPDWGVLDDVAKLRAEGDVVVDDLGRRPDTFPALCALAGTRRGVTRLCGAPALRGKESDRIAAMATGLIAAGCAVSELADGLVIESPANAEQPRLPATSDHRVVMALGVLATRLPRGATVTNAGAVAKSWPGFWEWLGRVAQVETS